MAPTKDCLALERAVSCFHDGDPAITDETATRTFRATPHMQRERGVRSVVSMFQKGQRENCNLKIEGKKGTGSWRNGGGGGMKAASFGPERAECITNVRELPWKIVRSHMKG